MRLGVRGLLEDRYEVDAPLDLAEDDPFGVDDADAGADEPVEPFAID